MNGYFPTKRHFRHDLHHWHVSICKPRHHTAIMRQCDSAAVLQGDNATAAYGYHVFYISIGIFFGFKPTWCYQALYIYWQRQFFKKSNKAQETKQESTFCVQILGAKVLYYATKLLINRKVFVSIVHNYIFWGCTMPKLPVASVFTVYYLNPRFSRGSTRKSWIHRVTNIVWYSVHFNLQYVNEGCKSTVKSSWR